MVIVIVLHVTMYMVFEVIFTSSPQVNAEMDIAIDNYNYNLYRKHLYMAKYVNTYLLYVIPSVIILVSNSDPSNNIVIAMHMYCIGMFMLRRQ